MFASSPLNGFALDIFYLVKAGVQLFPYLNNDDEDQSVFKLFLDFCSSNVKIVTFTIKTFKDSWFS